MKYNPKVNEDAALLTGFAHSHPLQEATTVQGNLALMYSLQEWLKEIGGFAGVSLQPAAGAHGEFTGVLIIRAYHQARGATQRPKVFTPRPPPTPRPPTNTPPPARQAQPPRPFRHERHAGSGGVRAMGRVGD